jgi:hypothetical protein
MCTGFTLPVRARKAFAAVRPDSKSEHTVQFLPSGFVFLISDDPSVSLLVRKVCRASVPGAAQEVVDRR